MNILRSFRTSFAGPTARGARPFQRYIYSKSHTNRAAQANWPSLNSLIEERAELNAPVAAGCFAEWRGKRALDIAIVLLAVPFTVLVCLFVGILIMADGRGPVFFTQERVGRGGRIFRIYKLRTMVRGINSDPTRANDPRITPLGALLRKYRIDELPQFLNVLKGDMSLIGPRPEQPHLVDYYRREIPGFDERHLMRPGITGLAQVQYCYASDLSETRNKVRYDRLYVRRQSLWLDLWIIVRTVEVMWSGFGAR